MVVTVAIDMVGENYPTNISFFCHEDYTSVHLGNLAIIRIPKEIPMEEVKALFSHKDIVFYTYPMGDAPRIQEVVRVEKPEEEGETSVV